MKRAAHRHAGTGHLDPSHAAALRGHSHTEPQRMVAFLRDARSSDLLAEQLGEAVVEQATSGEHTWEDRRDQVLPEEWGGPFVEMAVKQDLGGRTAVVFAPHSWHAKER